jgi:hypothetical protein
MEKKEEEVNPPCNNMACAKHQDTRLCSRCNIVAYCSTKCQRNDWFFHKRVCHPSLAFRLRALCRLGIVYFANYLHYPNLSSTSIDIFKKEEDDLEVFRVSAFRREVIDYYELCCAICATCGPCMALGSVLFAEKTWSYYRCTQCVSEGRFLCPTTLEDTQKCKNSKQEMFIRVSLLACANLLDGDVIRLIARLLVDLIECRLCSQ